MSLRESTAKKPPHVFLKPPRHLGGPHHGLNRSSVQTVSWPPKLLFSVLAAFFFVLGLLGALLPGLPATPFLLLTSYFLAKCSPRLNQALLRSPMFGPILRDWQEHRAVRTDVKLKAIIVVVVAVAVTVYASELAVPLALGVATLALVGILVIIRVPSLR